MRPHPELPEPAEAAIDEAIKELKKLPDDARVIKSLSFLRGARAKLAAYFNEVTTA